MGLISKATIILRRVKSASFARLNQNIQAIHNETGNNRLFILIDMMWCILRYGIGYLDYHVFGFAQNRGKNRKTFMTMHHNIGLTRMVNNPEFYPIMNDKIQFLETYGDFIGRKWIDLRTTGSEGLKNLCKNTDTVFVKPISDFGGTGVERITPDGNTDFDALTAKLLENRQYLVEEAVVQHEDLNKLCPSSVNTLRIVTLTIDNKPHFLYALLRVGSGQNHVDNISSGGMYTRICDSGILEFPAFCDKTGLYYDCHPVTQTAFKGFTVPMFNDAVNLCLQAAAVKPELAYIGWDVAITPSKPVLIEGNILPGYDMVQNSKFNPNKKGLLPTVEAIIGGPVPKA